MLAGGSAPPRHQALGTCSCSSCRLLRRLPAPAPASSSCCSLQVALLLLCRGQFLLDRALPRLQRLGRAGDALELLGQFGTGGRLPLHLLLAGKLLLLDLPQGHAGGRELLGQPLQLVAQLLQPAGAVFDRLLALRLLRPPSGLRCSAELRVLALRACSTCSETISSSRSMSGCSRRRACRRSFTWRNLAGQFDLLRIELVDLVAEGVHLRFKLAGLRVALLDLAAAAARPAAIDLGDLLRDGLQFGSAGQECPSTRPACRCAACHRPPSPRRRG